MTYFEREKPFPHLLRTRGTATAGVFFNPSIISGALSPYIVCIAFLCMTSEVPPRQLSSRNFCCSSEVIWLSFFCTASRTRIVDKFTSSIPSSSNLSSSQRKIYSSYWVFFVPKNVVSSDQLGKDTQVSLSTSRHSAVRPVHFGCV